MEDRCQDRIVARSELQEQIRESMEITDQIRKIC